MVFIHSTNVYWRDNENHFVCGLFQAGTAFIQNVMKNVSISTDAASAVQSTDLVLEAIVENLKIKQDLFGGLDKVAPS